MASALLASKLVECLGGEPCILLPEGLSHQSKKLLEGLNLELGECKGDPELVVVVDTANPAQLGGLQDLLEKPLILIDHHAPGILAEKALYSIVEPAASATELTANLLEEAGCRLGASEATLGLAGIIYDTKRFLLATPKTFRAAYWLASQGGDYTRALSLLSSQGPAPMPERMARLKAVSRLRLGRACKDILVAVTHIGSYESSVARSLVELGADVAVVLTERRDGYRASVRTSKLAEEHGIRADAVARYLAEKYGGQGGGHPGAAMAQLPFIAPSVEEATDLVAKSLPGKVARMCTGGRGR